VLVRALKLRIERFFYSNLKIAASVLFSLFETLVDVQDQFDSMLTNLFLLFDQMIVDPDSFQVCKY
jgi:hypothetical protein